MNIKKCTLRDTSITYLGHGLTLDGVIPDSAKIVDSAKIDVIVNMPPPEDKHGIQRLLGMVNYVAKFVPNVSSVTAPLRELLQKNIPLRWTTEHTEAFEKIKTMLLEHAYLAFYDVRKPVTLQVDACKTGLGDVLIQEDRPVSYAPRAMTDAQKRYAMIEKELLGVCIGRF